MIEQIIQYFLPCLINVMAVMYVLSKITNRKLQVKRPITYLVIFFLTIVMIINFIFIDDQIRFFTSTIAITFGSYMLFKDDFHKTFMSVIFEQVILFCAELLLMLIFILIFGANTAQVFANQGTILVNLEISAIAIILINIKPLLRLMQKVVNFVSNLGGMHKYFLIIVLMVTLNILLVALYSNTDNKSILFVNFLFILFYSYIVYVSLSEQNKNMIFKAENKVLVDNLEEYERVLDHQRVINHENKNQLLAIKGMIEQKENAIEYINQIITEQRAYNEKLYTKAKRIPSGGMQGIVYQKMVIMNEKEITVDLDISRNIRNIDFTKMNSKLNYDICRILGVVLDNAIEETEKIKKKQKEVNISMYADEQELVIEISNYFEQPLELDKMNEKGYTTKSKGHGYGLSLVKEIVENNDYINNERSITRDIFTQIIRIRGFE